MAETIETSENLAAVLHKKMDLRIEPVAIPELGDNDVLIRMSTVGICGSDIKYWLQGYCSGVFVLKDPMVLGHESSGQVIKLGHWLETEWLLSQVFPVEDALLCREGKYNLCPDMQFCATPPVNGSLCRFYVHPADFCFKLPETVSDEEGALMEPLAVAIHACRRGEVKTGSTVLVCGAGPVGILCMWVAKCIGASTVAVTDIDDYRLNFAKEQGADFTFNVSGSDEATVAQQVRDAIGCQPHVTIECSGSDFSMRLGIHATYPGGCIVQVGRGTPEPNIPLTLAATKEVDVRGCSDMQTAIQLHLN